MALPLPTEAPGACVTPPPPAEYARLNTVARGGVIAAMDAGAVWQYAQQYAAHLDTLIPSDAQIRVDPRDVFSQMMVCAVIWRDAQRQQQAVADS